jgi:hypothetical protein
MKPWILNSNLNSNIHPPDHVEQCSKASLSLSSLNQVFLTPPVLVYSNFQTSLWIACFAIILLGLGTTTAVYIMEGCR